MAKAQYNVLYICVRGCVCDKHEGLQIIMIYGKNKIMRYGAVRTAARL